MHSADVLQENVNDCSVASFLLRPTTPCVEETVPKWNAAIDKFKNTLSLVSGSGYSPSTLGSYGGRTLYQLPDIGFEVSVRRYLWDITKEIPLRRGRAGRLDVDATPSEITQMCGFVDSISCATPEGMPQRSGETSASSTSEAPTQLRNAPRREFKRLAGIVPTAGAHPLAG